VRVSVGFLKAPGTHGLRVYRLQVLDTIEGVLGLMPVLPSPARRSRSPLARRFNSASPSARSVMTDSTSGGYRIPTRVCLRVTKGTSEVDTVR
jgi:ribosomal protein L32